MTASIRETCLAAFAAALAAVAEDPPTGLEGLRFDRNTDFDETSFPTLVMHDGDEVFRGRTTLTDEKTVEVELEGAVQADDRATLEAALDALYVAINDALLADPTLGGAAFDLRLIDEPRRSRQMDAARPTGKLFLSWALDFEHAADRVSAPAPQ